MLGHVCAWGGEEYKLTGSGYTSLFFTVLLWSLECLPFGLPARSEYILGQLQLHQLTSNYIYQQQHLGLLAICQHLQV